MKPSHPPHDSTPDPASGPLHSSRGADSGPGLDMIGGGYVDSMPPDEPESELPAAELRRFCFKLIREVTGSLGWKYKLWIPAAVLLSSINLLPQRFLQYFTEGSQSLEQTPASDFLTLLVVFGVAVAVCQWIAIFFESLLGEWLRLTVGINLKRDAVNSLSNTRIDELDTAQRGDWMTRMTGDLSNAEDFVTGSLPEQITNLTLLIGSAALFFHHSGSLAVIPLIAAVFLAWFNIVVQKKMAPTLGAARVMEGGVFQSIIETFEGLRTIRSYGGEAFTISRINTQLKALFAAGMKVTKSMALLMGMNELVGQLVVTAVLTIVAYQVRGDQLTAQDALVYPFFINLFLGSAKSLVNAAYDWNRFFIEGGRLASLLYDDRKKERSNEERFGDFSQRTSTVTAIHARDITIAYGDYPPVIDQFDFDLNRGEIVTLMGPSGCGKSTFTESLAGLRHPSQGRFEITTRDGKTLTFSECPTFLSAFVEQQPYLFVGTIRDNIALGSAEVDDQLIWKALSELGLSERVRQQGGLDHLLADRGRNLSVGQQYRLALTRALVSKRPFLLMDEPFAALDPESIELVVEALKLERSQGTGILMITHVLPESLQPDRVIEMEAAPWLGGEPSDDEPPY